MQDVVSATVDASEVARFEKIARTWWDAQGPMGVLHKFNPVRLQVIRDEAAKHFRRDIGTGKPLEGLSLLDIGCGGGATTFAIADSMGASGSVIGVDISQSLIRDCRLRAEHQGIKNIEFICGDAASIDMPVGAVASVITGRGLPSAMAL